MDHIRLVVKLLEKLGVEQSNQEVEGGVVVRDHGEDGGFPLPQAPKVHFICLGDAGQGFQVELFQPCRQGDLDGL